MAGSGLNSGQQEDIRSDIRSIKSLLEQQSRTMSTQADQIARLTSEVGTLKTRVVSGGGGSGNGVAGGGIGNGNGNGNASALAEKDEKIRQLELELEELQS